LRQLLAAEKPDVIDICTPHHLHWPQLVEVSKVNCAVLVEKPVIIDPAHTRALENTWGSRREATIMRTNKTFGPRPTAFAPDRAQLYNPLT
jgi:predicted dehydrogenase